MRWIVSALTGTLVSMVAASLLGVAWTYRVAIVVVAYTAGYTFITDVVWTKKEIEK